MLLPALHHTEDKPLPFPSHEEEKKETQVGMMKADENIPCTGDLSSPPPWGW